MERHATCDLEIGGHPQAAPLPSFCIPTFRKGICLPSLLRPGGATESSDVTSQPFCKRCRLDLIINQNTIGVSNRTPHWTRPAHARWPGRHAERMRPPRAHMVMASRTGSTLAAASMPLCWFECCVPSMHNQMANGLWGIQHQQKHITHTTLLRTADFWLAHACGCAHKERCVGSHFAHRTDTRLEANRPQMEMLSNAQHCTMSDTTRSEGRHTPHTAACQHIREGYKGLQEQCNTSPTRVHTSSENGHNARSILAG